MSRHGEKKGETPDGDKPIILWLQGGPGWPSMYGLFKVKIKIYQVLLFKEQK